MERKKHVLNVPQQLFCVFEQQQKKRGHCFSLKGAHKMSSVSFIKDGAGQNCKLRADLKTFFFSREMNELGLNHNLV